ncbi:MAG: MFS transporter [Chloroflexota bacterium]
MLPLTDIEKQIRQHLRHNLIFNLADGGFFGFAMGFASFSTILPLFVATMTDSAILIGLVPAIHSMGWQLPQLFTAGHVSSLRRYKPHVLMMTIHERIPFLGLAVTALLIPMIGVKASILLAFMFLTWQGLGGGFTANAWTSMISKIIPADSRGTFFGAQAAFANILLGIAAVGAGYLLDWLPSPLDFAICFLIASIFFAVSWFALAQTREPESAEKIVDENGPSFWHEATRILKQDRNFDWFLAARFLSQFATMGFAFYILYALRRFDLNEVTAGYFTAALTLSQTVGNVGMGWIGDRIGHRQMLILGAIAALLSSTLAWFATSITWFFPIFILAGLANVSIWTTGIAMTVSFGTEKERPLYIGLSQTLAAPATIIAPLLGGLIVDAVSFGATFGISMVISLVMTLILFMLVKDPGKQAGAKPVLVSIEDQT